MHDGLEECTMHDSGISDDHRLLRREQFKASEKKRRVALFETMFRDFDNLIANLDGQIATEKSHQDQIFGTPLHIRLSPRRRPGGASISSIRWRM
jgi:hypothetical protein